MDGKWLKNLSTSEITVVIWGVITNVYSLDGEALYSQQQKKKHWKLTVAQIMNSLLPNSIINLLFN